jgi:probable HAF family extracellular repeat protein
MADLGPGAAHAINDAGQVIGASGERTFLWQHGVRTDLGFHRANDINAAGQVVGTYSERAGLWQGAVLTDLNDLLPSAWDWVLTNATATNESGQIVGVGVSRYRVTLPSGLHFLTHGFLLTPLPHTGS